jgi:2-(1,2-epoxy-1,2-dihydrophenyl)acetyl-CoA isomerase
MFETLLFEVREGVAYVTLNRPDAANAINLQLSKDLAYAAMRCDEDPAVRAVVLTGNGKMFCAGGDVRSFSESGDEMPALLKEITTYLHAAVSRFARMNAPLITAVQRTGGRGEAGPCGDLSSPGLVQRGAVTCQLTLFDAVAGSHSIASRRCHAQYAASEPMA